MYTVRSTIQALAVYGGWPFVIAPVVRPIRKDLLYLKCHSFSLDHRLSTTCKPGTFTPYLHKTRLGRLFFLAVLFLLLAFLGVWNCRKIRIAYIAMNSLGLRSLIMCISLMAMFWPEKLINAWFA